MVPDLTSFRDTLSRRLGMVCIDKVVILGVGNRLRGDDGLGPVLVDQLKTSLPHCVDTGETPEEYSGLIKRLHPSAIVFVDAVYGDAAPGEVCLIDIEDIAQIRICIHKLALDILMDYLRQETGADVFLIGIQSARLTSSSGLSPEIDEVVRRCAGIIRSILIRH
jgi:hydrogenase 3 maturation protease